MTPEEAVEAERKERQRLYEHEREVHQTNARLASQSYDKALLTLSSAFLGGSLAFTGQVVRLDTATWNPLLYWSWGLFAVTIVLTLLSFVYSMFKLQAILQAAERYYRDDDQEAWKVSEQVQRVVLRFVVACGVSFLLGILLLTAFIGLNLAKEADMAKNKPATPGHHESSVPPPTFQRPVKPETPNKPPAQPSPPQKKGS